MKNLGIGALGIIFITLKLVGAIHWSWVWVLAPLWIPLAVVFALFILAWVYYTFCLLTDK